LRPAAFWRGIGRARRFAAAGRRFERRLSARRAAMLILGDSTGVGVGATRPEESIAGLLAADYPDADIVNVAVSGTRVDGAIAQVQRCLEAGLRFDLALLHVGGNDVVANTPLHQLKDDCDTLLRGLGRLAARTAWLGPRTSGSRRSSRGPMPG
jgi:lysophospholipase L1-like esterase